MRISTRTHAILDLATAGFALAFPRLLGASDRFTNIMTTVAVGKITYGLLTRHELGAIKLLPMKTHLALDAAGGAAVCALPFVLDEEENPAITACAVGLGLLDIVAAPLTDSRSRPRVDDFHVAAPGESRAPAGARSTSWPGSARSKRLPRASLLDSLKTTSRVFIPNIAKGPIIRRPRVMAMGEQLELDTLSVKFLQQMRKRYGSGPLMLRLPFRKQAIILNPQHVRRVLDESPEPFATASTEKQAALAHFEPRVALASHGPERTARRRLNEQVLEKDRPVHPMSGRFLPIVDEEAALLLDRVKQVGELVWDDFIEAWFMIVRRIVFGDSGRNDRRITDLMARLRSDGNWAFLKPRRTDLRDELHQRIRGYIERAEPGSLAASMAERTRSPVQAPEQQIPQWLFAFDPAAMATFRALALLATHPQQMQRVRAETDRGEAAAQAHRPLLRAAVLESLRLWPTTPMILRQTTRETQWENGVMPAHTGILIFAPFFHRDEMRLPFAHTFNPDVWVQDDPQVKGDMPRDWPLVPFSGGTGVCPGRNVVLLLTSGMLAALIGDRTIRMKDPHRLPPGALPGTLDNYTLRFEVQGVAGRRTIAADMGAGYGAGG
jgi:cytochrome P450